jgi:hypothetical protein
VDHNLPIPPNPGSNHGWAELLALVGAIRRLADDRSLEPDDAMRRIRHLFLDDDHRAMGWLSRFGLRLTFFPVVGLLPYASRTSERRSLSYCKRARVCG